MGSRWSGTKENLAGSGFRLLPLPRSFSSFGSTFLLIHDRTALQRGRDRFGQQDFEDLLVGGFLGQQVKDQIGMRIQIRFRHRLVMP